MLRDIFAMPLAPIKIQTVLYLLKHLSTQICKWDKIQSAATIYATQNSWNIGRQQLVDTIEPI